MTGRILIADGVPTNRIVLRVKLTTSYYDVLQATTGEEALRIVAQERPDLVIASADLPDMEGRDFCARLRRQPGAEDMPIILVHSSPGNEDRLRALEAGADDVLPRPIDELVLLARLRSLLRARHAEDELRLRDDTRRALGLAEPPSGFEAPARIALVPVSASIDLVSAQEALAGQLPDRIELMAPEQTLRVTAPVPEVFVLVDIGQTRGEGLALLMQLRASPALRQSAIVYVAGPDKRQDAASALDLGANDLLARGLDIDELAIRLPKQIARKRTADRLRANMRHGLRAALTDPLTGLYNRRYALPHLTRLAERSTVQERPYAVLLADLDHFKRINDRHGHSAGDAVLREVGRRLVENLRPADLIARIGGEEFLIAMPDTDRDSALGTAERVCRMMASQPVPLTSDASGGIRVTLSIGIALPDLDEVEAPEKLLERADRALYAAKHGGRNRVSIVAPGCPPMLPGPLPELPASRITPRPAGGHTMPPLSDCTTIPPF